jgi:hypothetical protein
VNPIWLNAVATVIIGVLLVLSGILVVTTLLPSVDVGRLVVGLGAVLIISLAAMGVVTLRGRETTTEPERSSGAVARELQPLANRDTWRMPQLALLERPTWSRGRLIAMWALRGYLIVAVLLLAVRAIQIGTGHA